MGKKFIALAYVLLCYASATTEQRHLIVCVDSSIEHVASTNKCVTSDFASALHVAAAPMLVSRNIVHQFFLARQIFTTRAMSRQTADFALWDHFKNILGRLEHWTAQLQQHTANVDEIEHGSREYVKDELYTDELIAKRKKFLADLQDMDRATYRALYQLIKFDEAAWDFYDVNEDFYLCVPHPYAERFSDIGFEVAGLSKLSLPFDISRMAFAQVADQPLSLVSAFKKIFKSSQSYAWNIFIIGHGMNDRSDIGTMQSVCSLSLQSFKECVDYLERNVCMHLFIYQSCYGSGQHLHELFGTRKFSFPIVSCALSDNVAIRESSTRPRFTMLDREDVRGFLYDRIKKRWYYNIEFTPKWHKLFNAIEQDDLKFDALVQNFLENSVQIRLTGATSFSCSYTANRILINQRLVAAKAANGLPIVLDRTMQTILCDQPFVNIPVHIQQEDQFYCYSITPGPQMHRFSKIVVDQGDIDTCIRAWWPLDGQHVDKTWLIDELHIKNKDKHPMLRLIGCEDAQLVLCDCIIMSRNEQLMYIYATLQNDVKVGGIAYKIASKPQLVMLYRLDQPATERYSKAVQEFRSQTGEPTYTKDPFYQACRKNCKAA